MRRSTKRRLIPLALALALAVVGAALAVPTISVTVQDLGQGQATIQSEVSGATIKWNLDANNPDYLDSTKEVTVTISAGTIANTNGGTLYVKLYSGTTLVAVGSVTLDGSTTTYDVDLQKVPTDDQIGLDEFDTVYVVYQGP